MFREEYLHAYQYTVEGVALSELLKHTYQMVQFICAQDRGFYVMLTVALESGVSPSDIPIVSEYLDVFPSDINSLPPEREIEFSIDLIPGAEPVSVEHRTECHLLNSKS